MRDKKPFSSRGDDNLKRVSTNISKVCLNFAVVDVVYVLDKSVPLPLLFLPIQELYVVIADERHPPQFSNPGVEGVAKLDAF